MEQKEQKEQQWATWWRSRMCGNDGTQTSVEREAAVLREKKIWWRQQFGEEYAPMTADENIAAMRAQAEAADAAAPPRVFALKRPPMKDPVLFGCPCCPKLFTWRISCNDHVYSVHDSPGSDPTLSLIADKAKVLFHPQATEEEIKACLFVNLPWTDKAMLSPDTHSSDMSLCYVTRRLVLEDFDEYE